MIWTAAWTLTQRSALCCPVAASSFHFHKFCNGHKIMSFSSSTCRAALSKTSEEEHYVKSPYPDVQIPDNITVPEYLKASIGQWEADVAYECGVSGRQYKYKQVFEISRAFGASLIQSGFKKGDCIAIVLPNVPEYASVIFGIWEAGLACTPVNPSYMPNEIERQLSICNAKAVVTTPEFVVSVKKSVAECRDFKSIIVIGDQTDGCHSFSEMIKTNPAHVTFPTNASFNIREDTCYIPFSSGTTGLPKGVCLTHYNLLANLMQCMIPELVHQTRRVDQIAERSIGLLPFFHAFGMSAFITMGLYNGAHIMCLPRFVPELFLKAVRKHKPTTLHLVTPLISYIVNSPDYGQDELGCLEMVVGGGAPVGPSLIGNLLKKAQKHIIYREGYGMTELSPASHVGPLTTHSSKIGSCGQPIPNTITKIIDTKGNPVGRNERGEICIKGPQVMKGYLNNDEATRNTIDSDGWLHTGDIAYYDDDGFCYIVDRMKELIKVKGFQVAPSELEDLLRKHAIIADVAVIGIASEEWGEVPRAYIVRNNESLTEEDVHSFLKDKAASYKQLRGGVEFVQVIPKAPTGKILRRELIQKYNQQPVA